MQAIEFLEQFANPDPRFSPVPIWWWSGEKLDIRRLRWQMDQLSGMGIHNVLILNLAPNGTLFGCDPDDPPFLSEPWWSIFEQVCDHAKSIGMFVWFYDQIGFSGASFQADITAAHPEYLAEQIGRVFVEGTGSLSLEPPIDATPIAAYVFPIEQPNAIRTIPIDGHRCSIHVDTPSRLCLVYSQKQGYDYFSRSACDELLRTVHGEFQRRLPQHLGTTIVGSFQDELPDMPTWGKNFDQTFQEINGYRLSEVIHHLFEPGDGESRRTRLRYHQLRASLAEDAFFKPFFHWHQERGLQCGFDQQSPAREARVLGSVAKYADYIQTQRWYAIPGSDLHGNGKLHSSIAFMYSRPRVWIEGFHSTGWGGTIADTFDWLLPYLRAGANLYNPHAVYYSMRQGWWEWAPPSTCWRQPYARHYRPFAEMIARLTKLLSVGIQQANVGVLFPTATVQGSLGPMDAFADAQLADRVLHETIGSMRWHQAKLGPLDELAIDFHLLDEETIVAAELEGDALVFRKVGFRTIVLPHVTMIHDRTLERLRSFAEMGGRIIAIGTDEVETQTGAHLRISSRPNARFIHSATSLATALEDAPRLIGSPVPTLYRRDQDVHVLLVPAVAGMASEVKWPNWFAPMEHTTIVPERYRKAADLVLPASAKTVWRFDPWTGKSRRVETDGRNLALDFEGSPFAVLVWSESDAVLPPLLGMGRAIETEIELSHEWTCEYVPTLPSEYADIYDPNHAEVRWPITTDFKWLRGQVDADFSRGFPATFPAEIVRATFGVRARRIDANDPMPKPIIYSPSFGIQQDGIHTHTLGPKGYVPEEFIDLGKLTAGQEVTIQSGVISEAEREVILAVGANSTKAAVVNGVPLRAGGNEYLWFARVKLPHGESTIELRLTAERNGTVRAFWCLVDPSFQDLFRRPERIAAEGTRMPGASVVYSRRFEVAEALGPGELKVSIAAMANVFLDGNSLGSQGGFDPYRPMMRGQIYSTPVLQSGEHELRVEVFETKSGAPLVVDWVAGNFALMSDGDWTASRNGAATERVRIYDSQSADGAAWHLWRRPHPLGAAAFGERQGTHGVVIDVPLLAPCRDAQVQWFEWLVPPGARSMRMDIDGDATLWIDGVREVVGVDGTVELSDDKARAARTAVLRVLSRQLSGGVFLKPVVYQFGEGIFRTGSWLAQGLRSFSGAIRLRQSFSFSASGRERIFLDLGRVRGTVEARLNGRELGIHCLSPYCFEVTEQVKPGVNELDLLVTNTLANHLSTWGPTRWWSPDQLEAGIFGPVRIVRHFETI